MSAPSPYPSEYCDVCRAPLVERHQHLLAASTRKLECVCDPCAILFSSGHQKYRRVPSRIRYLPDFQIDDVAWNGLLIPIGLAFFVRDSRTGRVSAIYPSPAGPVESQLALEAWDDITSNSVEVRSMQEDVEGLLAYRVGTAREHFIISIDEFFKMIGMIRLKWKGLSGGILVWHEIGKFLEELKRKSESHL